MAQQKDGNASANLGLFAALAAVAAAVTMKAVTVTVGRHRMTPPIGLTVFVIKAGSRPSDSGAITDWRWAIMDTGRHAERRVESGAPNANRSGRTLAVGLPHAGGEPRDVVSLPDPTEPES